MVRYISLIKTYRNIDLQQALIAPQTHVMSTNTITGEIINVRFISVIQTNRKKSSYTSLSRNFYMQKAI